MKKKITSLKKLSFNKETISSLATDKIWGGASLVTQCDSLCNSACGVTQCICPPTFTCGSTCASDTCAGSNCTSC